MIRVLRRSSRNRKNQSRFEELDLPLLEIGRLFLRLDHIASFIVNAPVECGLTAFHCRSVAEIGMAVQSQSTAITASRAAHDDWGRTAALLVYWVGLLRSFGMDK